MTSRLFTFDYNVGPYGADLDPKETLCSEQKQWEKKANRFPIEKDIAQRGSIENDTFSVSIREDQLRFTNKSDRTLYVSVDGLDIPYHPTEGQYTCGPGKTLLIAYDKNRHLYWK